MRLTGKVAVVTGVKSGIGLATAGRFAAEGAAVVLTDREDASAEARMLVESGATAVFIRADPFDAAQVAELVGQVQREFGRIDVLVNNAIPNTAISADGLARVGLSGALLWTKAAIPAMSSGGGAIVNVSSELTLVGSPNTEAVSRARAMLLDATRSLAAEHAGHRIRVNSLCPGVIATQRFEESVAVVPDPAALRKTLEDRTLLGRLGRPEEVAAACTYLASDDSSYMTGSVLILDGGWSTR
jgi:NAD(P)-dependent dehydrogenase (short-subunit alcohol dehydrogenase family)